MSGFPATKHPPTPGTMRCVGCMCDFVPTRNQWIDYLRHGGGDIFCDRQCWSDYQARKRKERDLQKAKKPQRVVKRPAPKAKREIRGLGPDEPLNPPRKCAGLPGKPCDTLTYNRRCDTCLRQWRVMHLVVSGRISGEEYGGFCGVSRD